MYSYNTCHMSQINTNQVNVTNALIYHKCREERKNNYVKGRLKRNEKPGKTNSLKQNCFCKETNY